VKSAIALTCPRHHWTNWTNEKRNRVRFLERIFSQLTKMKTKRLLRFWKGLLFDRPIVFALRPPPSSTSALVRSKRQKVICLPDRQLQQAKFICKAWSLSVSELQLTAPANAGVQKAESVCKYWRLSVSELHTYFVEEEVYKICRRSRSPGSVPVAVFERPQLVCPKADLFGRPLQHCIGRSKICRVPPPFRAPTAAVCRFSKS